MAKYLVQKSVPLMGEVNISGAKNAVLPLMSAAILAKDECRIKDVPRLLDVKVMRDILESFGGVVKDVEDDEHGTVLIDMSGLNKMEAEYELASQMRASFLVTGPLLSREGYAKVYVAFKDIQATQEIIDKIKERVA